jgi:hypothetical protein
MFCIFFSSRKTAIMSGSPPTQFYERRKKSRHDVDAGEGSSRNPQPGTSIKRTMQRDHPRGHMHIDIEIEEFEKDPMETSDDESAEDETYRMSPVPAPENSIDGSDDSRVEHEAIEEEEGRVEGTLNPHSCRRDHFDPSPTIRIFFVVRCGKLQKKRGNKESKEAMKG